MNKLTPQSYALAKQSSDRLERAIEAIDENIENLTGNAFVSAYDLAGHFIEELTHDREIINEVDAKFPQYPRRLAEIAYNTHKALTREFKILDNELARRVQLRDEQARVLTKKGLFPDEVAKFTDATISESEIAAKEVEIYMMKLEASHLLSFLLDPEWNFTSLKNTRLEHEIPAPEPEAEAARRLDS